MKRAILHIGTEKTGTTSIQTFLFQNRRKLLSSGRLFPESAGYSSNQRLVVYGKNEPEADLVDASVDVKNAAELASFKDRFVQEHCREVLTFQSGQKNESTVIYSAEHLQSRLTTIEEIRRVARLLRPMFDELKILVYLRRQDKYALSAHSTSVRCGNQRDFSFEEINAAGPYYNYRKLLENWSEVFGQEAIMVRLFERRRMERGDAVSDFCRLAGIDIDQPGIELPTPENEALSHTALSMLRRFNSLPEADPRLHGLAKQDVRGFLLERVQLITDEFGRFLPPRSSAEAFYTRFAEDNQWIADCWLDGLGFEDSFLDYPEAVSPLPVIEDIDQRLDELIEAFTGWRQGVAKRFAAAILQRLHNRELTLSARKSRKLRPWLF